MHPTCWYFTKEAGYPIWTNSVFFSYVPLHLLLQNLQGYHLFLYIPFKVSKNNKPNFIRKLCLQYYFPLCPEISKLGSFLGQLAFWQGRTSFPMSARIHVLWLLCYVIFLYTFYPQDFHFTHVSNCSWLHITEGWAIIIQFLVGTNKSMSKCHMSHVPWLPLTSDDYIWKTISYVNRRFFYTY